MKENNLSRLKLRGSIQCLSIMCTPKLKVIITLCLAGVICLLAFAASSPVTPRVSLQLRGYQTNELEDVPGLFTNTQYVCAVVCMTNNSTQPVFYFGNPLPFYDCSVRTIEEKWVNETPMRCGFGAAHYTLKPSQSATFTVLLHGPERPLLVSVDYTQPRATDKLWRVLPQQLTQWIPPWIKGTRKASITIHRVDSRR